jgi:predicted transglutaminase-like cysteine proteinase
MKGFSKTILSVTFLVLTATSQGASARAGERPLFVSVGAETRAPIGWLEFCDDNPQECADGPAAAKNATLSPRAWRELKRINDAVNRQIQPVTDMDHYGVVEKWTYPEDGYGDCEDYVLLKRKLLIGAGWPRQSLLITVVRDQKGEGHAVLTVKTDKGEFILDNQNPEILLWSKTEYRYVKRQTQTDPNAWVSLGDPRPALATATSR